MSHLIEFSSLSQPDEDGLKIDGLWLNASPLSKKRFVFTDGVSATLNVMSVVEINAVM